MMAISINAVPGWVRFGWLWDRQYLGMNLYELPGPLRNSIITNCTYACNFWARCWPTIIWCHLLMDEVVVGDIGEVCSAIVVLESIHEVVVLVPFVVPKFRSPWGRRSFGTSGFPESIRICFVSSKMNLFFLTGLAPYCTRSGTFLGRWL